MLLHQVQGSQAQVRGPRGYQTCTSTLTPRSGRQRRREHGSDSLFEQHVFLARRVAFNAVALDATPAPSAGRAGPAPAMDAPASAAAAAAEDDD